MTRHARPRDVGRIEAFSDAVLAIVLTLLVLELLPDGPRSPTSLLADWPTYVAYLTAFFTIGTVWLNHNQAIARLQRTDPVVLVLNLGLLLGASLVPWPTALVSAALTDGDRADQIAAMIVFAVVTVVISIPWTAMDLYLARHSELLTGPGDAAWMRRHAVISAGTLLIAGVSVALAFVSPLASLLLYIPVFAAFMVARLRERAS